MTRQDESFHSPVPLGIHGTNAEEDPACESVIRGPGACAPKYLEKHGIRRLTDKVSWPNYVVERMYPGMIILTDEEDEDFNLEALTEATVISCLGVAIIVSNVIIIATYLNARGPQEVINIYILSIAAADLMCGLLVVPLSVYPAMVQRWIYGDLLCRFTGYIEVSLWVVTIFSFMWMSVDRYLAVRKPLRYDTVQTKTRCQCWMAFTWISSLMLCCPPLLGFYKPLYNKEAHICMLDWGNMAAYTITLGILVLVPSLITIVYTYWYIFLMMRRLRHGVPIHDKEYATALAENLANPSHVMSFILIAVFWLSWTPYAGVRLYEYVSGAKIQVPYLQFGIVWMGVANSAWKSFILLTFSPQFRLFFRLLCLTMFCRTKSRLQGELIDLDED